MNPNRITLMTGVIAAAYSHRFTPGHAHGPRTFHAEGLTSAGAGAAQVKLWGSNVQNPSIANMTQWVLLTTIDLVLATTLGGGGAVIDAEWTHMVAELVSISGTDASVNVYFNG